MVIKYRAVKTSISINHPHIKRHSLITLGISIAMSFLYLLINHRVEVASHQNFLFPLEHQLPFNHHMIWGYILALLIAIFMPMLITNQKTFLQAMYTNAISFTLNALVWLFYPVTYPRVQYSWQDEEQLIGASELLYSKLISIDTSLNSFPSGHATLLFIIVWLSISLSKKRWKLIIISMSLIGLASILLIKQHSIVDILGGFFTAWAGIIASCKLTYKA